MNAILAVMFREYRIRITSMTWIFYDLLVPLLYLLLFGIAFNATFAGGVEAGSGRVSYQAFFLPGVLSMASFGIAVNSAYGFFLDRDNGIFYEFLTYPMTRAQFLIGKILFSCLLAVLQSAITIAAATWLLHADVHWEAWEIVAAITVTGTAGWFFFLSIAALRIRRNDLFNSLINLVYFLLMFASSIFYPLDALPSWLRLLALMNPLTWHTDILRQALLSGTFWGMELPAAGFLAFLILSFLFAVHTLQSRVIE